MTREEFQKLKPGDKIIGRKNGRGTVVWTARTTVIQWDNNNTVTFPLNVLNGLWRIWEKSPMSLWTKEEEKA